MAPEGDASASTSASTSTAAPCVVKAHDCVARYERLVSRFTLYRRFTYPEHVRGKPFRLDATTGLVHAARDKHWAYLTEAQQECKGKAFRQYARIDNSFGKWLPTGRFVVFSYLPALPDSDSESESEGEGEEEEEEDEEELLSPPPKKKQKPSSRIKP